ncbi:MAG: FKBP-type peptidyl-prolyl cis-trans isomerase [Candidatus Aminicenantes bacterium]|nr:FKBP-type peptidyl-prolyl cis-trans isomerase [Candidatus Aminicenantes bacterium]
MKKGIIITLTCLTLLAWNCSKSQDKKSAFETEKQKAGYAVGYDLASSSGIKEIEKEIDVDTLVQGFTDALKGREGKINKEDRQKFMEEFRKEMSDKINAERKEQDDKNKLEGENFLKENAQKEGIKTTASGLQYEVLKEGTGAAPKATDNVTVHYKGTLLNGNEFDSSFKRGEPAGFPLNKVIKGWGEGLQLMKVGAKYRFFIPSQLAYGEAGVSSIPPNSVLIFEIELLAIN